MSQVGLAWVSLGWVRLGYSRNKVKEGELILVCSFVSISVGYGGYPPPMAPGGYGQRGNDTGGMMMGKFSVSCNCDLRYSGMGVAVWWDGGWWDGGMVGQQDVGISMMGQRVGGMAGWWDGGGISMVGLLDSELAVWWDNKVAVRRNRGVAGWRTGGMMV